MVAVLLDVWDLLKVTLVATPVIILISLLMMGLAGFLFNEED